MLSKLQFRNPLINGHFGSNDNCRLREVTSTPTTMENEVKKVNVDPQTCGISQIIAAAFPGITTKQLAYLADADPETARKWQRGICEPSFRSLQRLCAASPLFTQYFISAGG